MYNICTAARSFFLVIFFLYCSFFLFIYLFIFPFFLKDSSDDWPVDDSSENTAAASLPSGAAW